MTLTNKERELVNNAVERSVDTILVKFGWDLDDPKEVRADIAHLKLSRKLCALVLNRWILATVTVVAGGTVGAAWYAFVQLINRS